MTTAIIEQPAYQLLASHYHITPGDTREVWMTCPWCGKDNHHFSFSARGYKCFACNEAGKNMAKLAQALGITSDVPRKALQRPPVERKLRPAYWQTCTEKWISRFCSELSLVTAWNAYKPLSLESLQRYRLGVGRLPMWNEERGEWYLHPHKRLIVPVYDAQGRCVALHGRAYRPADTGKKWLSASGSNKRELMVVGDLQPGCTVIIVENYVDTILAHQIEPGAAYLPIGGVTMWQPAWTQRLVTARPAQVVIWLDHDLSGNGSRYHEREMLADWEAAIRGRGKDPHAVKRPIARGPQLANELLAAGLHALVYVWPRGTPHKADIGWALSQGGG